MNIAHAYYLRNTVRFLDKTSAWIQHIPFLHYLVEAQKPRTFVELGTHMGVSYCAACQIIADLNLKTSAYAIDTWAGDAHTDAYSADVFTTLKQYHDPLYGGFSQLVCSTFDDAVQHFTDGSLDLIHVDGLHTYEAVKHDYETWLPKLANLGVMIFHDTNVRERHFGVYRLWEELSQQHPSFEFLHGHGLGVLAPKGAPDCLQPLLACAAHEEEANMVRQHFFMLGASLSQRVGWDDIVHQLHQSQQREGETLAKLSVATQGGAMDPVLLHQQLQTSRSDLAKESRKNARLSGEIHSGMARVLRDVARHAHGLLVKAGKSLPGRFFMNASAQAEVDNQIEQGKKALRNDDPAQASDLFLKAATSGRDLLQKLRGKFPLQAVISRRELDSLTGQIQTLEHAWSSLKKAAAESPKSKPPAAVPAAVPTPAAFISPTPHGVLQVRPEPDTSNPLWQYFITNQGKVIHKWHHYFDIYHNHFARYRNTDVVLLEIGVNKGGSLQMWKNYFGPKARIYGVDINPDCKKLEEEQVQIFIGDQSERAFLRELRERIGRIDILIDDGGHTMEQQITTCQELYPAVSPSGVFLVEDLHTSYWPEYSGGYRKPDTFIEYAKSFLDEINAYHSRDAAFQPTELTRTSTGVHVYDSIIVIEKYPNDKPPIATEHGTQPTPASGA